MRFFQHGRRREVGPSVRDARRFEAAVEGMEDRRLLSGSGAAILLSGTIIEVIGSDRGDTGMASVRDGIVDVKMANSGGSDEVTFPLSQVSMIEYFGGAGDNHFTNATSLTGLLIAGSGNNVLDGGSGVDYLMAFGNGNNVLNAGSGTEFLEVFGNGTNTMHGGAGYDTMYTFSGTNQITGGTGSSYIIAIGGQNHIDGGPGQSIVYSFSSTDVIVPRAKGTIVHIGY